MTELDKLLENEFIKLDCPECKGKDTGNHLCCSPDYTTCDECGHSWTYESREERLAEICKLFFGEIEPIIKYLEGSIPKEHKTPQLDGFLEPEACILRDLKQALKTAESIAKGE